MLMKSALALSCFWIVACGAAAAQAPPVAKPSTEIVPPPASSPGSNGCAQTQPVPSQGTIAPEGGTTGQSREPLGDKLAKSDGVLCPPTGVDPEIRAPTPDSGSMRVIPPPGSPGGDPTMRPK
jgi:hypothetical protein